MSKAKLQYGRAIVSGVALAMLLMVVTGFSFSPRASTAESSGLAWICKGCTWCATEDNHKTLTEGANWEVAGEGHPNDCLVGTCAEHHNQCAVSRGEMERAVYVLNTKLPDASGDDVRKLVAELGNQVSLNQKRGAVQVLGCDGEVVAHFRLAKKQLVELTE